MTEHEQMNQRNVIRHARILEILLGAYLAATLAFGGWVAAKVTDNSQRIAVIEHRLDRVEHRLDRIEARLSRIESALNILVARKNAEEGLADAGASKQSKLATE